MIGQQLGRWVGIKAIFHSIDSGRSVMLEKWIDENSNINWHRVFRYTDSAYWGGGFPNSGGSDNQVITWGGPIAIFSWNNMDDMDAKILWYKRDPGFL